jgi:small subunit ribosomal protein S20
LTPPPLADKTRAKAAGVISAVCVFIVGMAASRSRAQDDPMANTKSARKATRKIARRTAVNKSRRSQMRTAVRDVEAAIASGDKKSALAALKAAEPQLVRAARKGVLHKKTASRKISRLTKQLAKLP